MMGIDRLAERLDCMIFRRNFQKEVDDLSKVGNSFSPFAKESVRIFGTNIYRIFVIGTPDNGANFRRASHIEEIEAFATGIYLIHTASIG